MCTEDQKVAGFCICCISPNLSQNDKEIISKYYYIFISWINRGPKLDDYYYFSVRHLFILLDFFAIYGKKIITTGGICRGLTANECIENYCDQLIGVDNRPECESVLRNLKNFYLAQFFQGSVVDRLDREPTQIEKRRGEREFSFAYIMLICHFFALHGECIHNHIS